MHILFIDESGNLSPPGKSGSKNFVLGGLIIPEEIWPKLSADLKRLKKKYKITGEIKWRYFIHSNRQPENSLLHLKTFERDELRLQLFQAMARYKSIKVISIITDTQRSYLILPFAIISISIIKPINFLRNGFSIFCKILKEKVVKALMV